MWNITEYGIDDKKIEVLIFSEPINNILVGKVSSQAFVEDIAIGFYQHDDIDFGFACLARESDGSKPRIFIEPELAEKLKNGTEEAKLILFHEIGHYVNNDQNPNDADLERENAIRNEYVSIKELFADEFAASYIGKDAAITGLEQLAQNIRDKYYEHADEESFSLAMREIELRIEHLRMK